jgi:RNA polymerase sigma-70 factor (ECF subfamily)
VAAVLAGRREEFAQLVTRYEGPLLRLAISRLGRRDLAEEAVQETFFCAYKSLASYDSRFSFRTWLWTILLNQCRRTLARGARRPRVQSFSDHDARGDTAPAAAETASDHAAPSASLLAKERSAELAALLAQLPEAQADALRLRFFGELKFQEIADAMGCSLATAKNRVRWGLERLSALVQEAGATQS